MKCSERARRQEGTDAWSPRPSAVPVGIGILAGMAMLGGIGKFSQLSLGD
jgi:hypothetical protein